MVINFKNTIALFLLLLLAILLGIFLLFFSFVLPPQDFPDELTIVVADGTSITTISGQLYESNLIRSPRLFQIYMAVFGLVPRSGDYRFQSPLSMWEVARRLDSGKYGDVIIRITIPEGVTNQIIADTLSKNPKLRNYDPVEFLRLANTLGEGALFPNTYNFFPSASTEYIIDKMHNEWKEQLEDLTGLEPDDVPIDLLVFASLIEKEASGRNLDESKMVAGILQNRLDRGIKLQVDAPFLYILGKESSELTLSDLRIDSPYNTYLYNGLPPTPISNYGRMSIQAALDPTVTNYLFYLHDKNGNIHYAKTNAGHVVNKNKYLR